MLRGDGGLRPSEVRRAGPPGPEPPALLRAAPAERAQVAPRRRAVRAAPARGRARGDRAGRGRRRARRAGARPARRDARPSRCDRRAHSRGRGGRCSAGTRARSSGRRRSLARSRSRSSPPRTAARSSQARSRRRARIAAGSRASRAGWSSARSSTSWSARPSSPRPSSSSRASAGRQSPRQCRTVLRPRGRCPLGALVPGTGRVSPSGGRTRRLAAEPGSGRFGHGRSLAPDMARRAMSGRAKQPECGDFTFELRSPYQGVTYAADDPEEDSSTAWRRCASCEETMVDRRRDRRRARDRSCRVARCLVGRPTSGS